MFVCSVCSCCLVLLGLSTYVFRYSTTIDIVLKSQCVCVCVCVCERERERERESTGSFLNS